jgi:glycosyltransferase involved in cell wall biosynthesis
MIKISIIVTNYNYGHYLGRCLRSLLSQSINREDYEIIVVDDASTDSSHKIYESFKNEIKTIKIAENVGLAQASNIGIRSAVGRYFVRVDADDMLCSNYLSVMEEIIREGCPSYVYSNYWDIDAEGGILREVDLPEFSEKEIFFRGDFLATGTMYNKKIFNALGGYKTEVKNCGLENYDLILRLIKGGYCGHFVPTALFKYRRHQSNLSVRRYESIISFGNKLFSENDYGSYSYNQFHPYLKK